MIVRAIAALALSAALPAGAYCVHNDLKGKDVRVVRDNSEGGDAQDLVLKPADKFCCTPKDTSCNPEGKITSNVDLEVTIQGTPAYRCGISEKKGQTVKVTGGGSVHVVNNPKASSALPYVVRIRTQDRDVSGPSGVQCTERKGN